MGSIEEIQCLVQEVTHGPFYHFFGYYDKCPWDVTERYLLAMRVAFMDRPLTPDDIAVIGYLDLEDECHWHPLAETVAWYWQQGTMLQWMPSAPGREIIFNTRTADVRGRRVSHHQMKSSPGDHPMGPLGTLSVLKRYNLDGWTLNARPRESHRDTSNACLLRSLP